MSLILSSFHTKCHSVNNKSHPPWSSLQELLRSLHRGTVLFEQQRDVGTSGDFPPGGDPGLDQTTEVSAGETAEQGLRLDQPGGGEGGGGDRASV